MQNAGLRAENQTLRTRLSGLTEAMLRISEELDLDAVLQRVVDAARSLTGARYGAIMTIDDAGALQDLLISGLSDDEMQELVAQTDGPGIFRLLSNIEGQIRSADFIAYLQSMGFDEFSPRIGAFLGTEICVRDGRVGHIYIGEKEDGAEFTQEDEDTLELFAGQAAVAIVNARRYGAEQRANSDLEALVNTSPVGVLVFDAATRDVVTLNREAQRIFGVPAMGERPVARHLETIAFRRLDGSDVPAHELPLERAIRSGETERAAEFVIHRPDGERVSVLINTTPIHSEENGVLSVVATIQDITPLEELERLRAEFLGMVSHELRTPLASIKGSAATVLGTTSPLDPAETRQFVRIIEEQADHMRDLINNLLDLTRIETGTLSVVAEPTDLSDVIDQARNAFLSGGYRNTIEVDVSPELPRVSADRQRLVQVLHNLFSNASQYSREWSVIAVEARAEDLHVAVSVIDEGAGISAENLPRLFSKFSRIEVEGRPEVNRHGLGLAICRGIIEAHGGRISATSDGENRGTRFTFTLPVVDPVAHKTPNEPPSERAQMKSDRREGQRILVVDDDPQILRYVRNTLSEAGYRVLVTGDPDRAADLIKDEDPHLALLNLVLPRIDGFELMQRIRNDSDVAIIILSGRGRGQDIARAFELGADDYVVKPFSSAELVARVKAALRKRARYQRTLSPEPFSVGALTINYTDRTVTVAGEPADLTATEYRFLCELADRPGRAVSHDQLLERVWGRNHSGSVGLVRAVVKNVRQKLGDDARRPSYVVTEPGVGYRLAAP
ncbi:MAG: response regulator [Chloroflexi bacterium]|nr:response regulator [Chloroflexota bacterium]MYD48883.1 response regulator [Chloroflexota bacterium]